MRKRLLVDCDEVLADFQTPALRAIWRHTGRRMCAEDFEVWDVFSVITEEDRKGVFAEIGAPGWCAALQPKEGAQEAIQQLRDLVDVYAVTSHFPSPTWVPERDEWLTRHFRFASDEIVHTKAKYLCKGDAFLDDNPEHVRKWRAEHPQGAAMLWHIPNTRFLGYDDIRVRTWDEVLSKVRALV